MKKTIITLLKVLLPLAIILWLLASVNPQDLQHLRDREKDWVTLGLAFAMAMLAVCLTFVRWYLLVRTLHIPFRLSDAFRLGFLGFLLNFVGVGSVGGDVFKAVFIAREQSKRRAEAVATVLVDRMIGLYALLLVTSGAILLGGISKSTTALAAICNATLLATAFGAVCIMMVLVPGFTRGSLSEFVTGLPKVGHTIGRVIESVRMFRNRYDVMSLILAMSMVVHVMLAVSIFLIARGLFGQTPTLGEHMIIVPLSNVAGAIPFMPGGLGTFEFAMEKLYVYVPANGPGEVIGVLVALAYRIVTIAIAAVGVVYYWTSRREVRQVISEAEHEREEVSRKTSELVLARNSLP
ncbi:MAG: flippase-like domain-containing protein [Planctomycetaceae bacterium]|nr:flippase-like domain-containing protein [Planctomycetales bacterium]MCB9927625.1 flippase-like domain-containing protein [Planctomycetaceae bacterium]